MHSETEENAHRFIVLLHFSVAFRLPKLPENWNSSAVFSVLPHPACIGHRREKRKTAFIIFQSVESARARARTVETFATLHQRVAHNVFEHIFCSTFFNVHKLDAAAHSPLEHGRLEEELTGKIVLKKSRQKKWEKRGNKKKSVAPCFLVIRCGWFDLCSARAHTQRCGPAHRPTTIAHGQFIHLVDV